MDKTPLISGTILGCPSSPPLSLRSSLSDSKAYQDGNETNPHRKTSQIFLSPLLCVGVSMHVLQSVWRLADNLDPQFTPTFFEKGLFSIFLPCLPG